MKLRVIQIYDVNRMAGWYIVQEKRWFFWEDLYHDMDADSNQGEGKLVRNMVLGNANIKLAQFGDINTAKHMAQLFRKEHEKGRQIIGVWKV